MKKKKEYNKLKSLAIGLVILPVAILFFGGNGEIRRGESNITFDTIKTDQMEQIEQPVDSSDAVDIEDIDEGREGLENDVTEESIVIVCDIDGAVANPGVYELKEGSRINDLILAAGGLEEDAYIANLNRARILMDGEKIYVYSSQDIEKYEADENKVSISENDGDPYEPNYDNNGTQNNGISGSHSSPLININSANEEELETIPGVGPVTAQKIIEYRQEKGRFDDKSELKNISGIGEKTYKKMEEYVTV